MRFRYALFIIGTPRTKSTRAIRTAARFPEIGITCRHLREFPSAVKPLHCRSNRSRQAARRRGERPRTHRQSLPEHDLPLGRMCRIRSGSVAKVKESLCNRDWEIRRNGDRIALIEPGGLVRTVVRFSILRPILQNQARRPEACQLVLSDSPVLFRVLLRDTLSYPASLFSHLRPTWKLPPAAVHFREGRA